jgi:release factor glutamine methyltransferase
VTSATAPRGRDLYRSGIGALEQEQEVRWILEEAAGVPWHIALDEALSERAEAHFSEMILRRSQGEPLQYVLGSWSFRGIDLMVDRRVLIPRPETEQVVDAALEQLDRISVDQIDGPRPLVVADLGTGSGAIALSIAAERPGVSVWATDASPPALEVARANLSGMAGFAAARVRLVLGSWWSALPEELRGALDLVVSNPPYVSSSEMRDLEPQVREWEPTVALEAGPAGLDAIEEILGGAPEWLRPGGAVVLEIAPAQSGAASRIARSRGFSEVSVLDDLAGRPRTIVAATCGRTSVS